MEKLQCNKVQIKQHMYWEVNFGNFDHLLRLVKEFVVGGA